MFTGIVMGIGRVLTVTPLADGVHIAVDSRALELEDVRLGDSIAHSGVCLTVVARQGTVLEYDVSGETLACSVGLNEPGRELNLEKALRLGDALGGHLVTGHVEKRLGKPFRPGKVHVVGQLPKTRSSKIMRRVIRSVYCGQPPGDLSSLDNPAALDEVRAAAA